MADKIVSWGGYESKGTSGMSVTGSMQVLYTTTSVVHGEGNTLLELRGINGSSGTNNGRFKIGYNENDPSVRLNSNGVSVNTGTWYFTPQTWFLGGITSNHNSALKLDGMTNGVTSGTAGDIIKFTQRNGQFASFYDAGSGLSEFRIWQQSDSSKYIYLKPGQQTLFNLSPVTIKGAGTTSSTTSLLVQNANASSSFQVRDDGVTVLQATSASLQPLQIKDSTGTYALGLGQYGGANYVFSLKAPHNFGIEMASGNVFTISRPSQNEFWFIQTGLGIYTNKSTNSIYSGTAGAFGFYTYGSTQPMPVLYQNDRTGNDDYGFKLVGKTAGTEFIGVAADRFGNVGIGTASPAYKLDVSGSGRFTDGLTITGSVNISGSSNVNGNSTVIGNLYVTSPASSNTSNNGLVLGFGRYSTVEAGLFGSSDGVIPNSNGNIYIAPRNINSGNGAYMVLGQRDSTNSNDKGTIVLQAGSYGTNNQTGDIFLNYGNGTRVLLDGATANVGINTYNPTAKLHVLGSGTTSSTTSLLVQNSSATNLLQMRDDGALYLGTKASGLGTLVITTHPTNGTKVVMQNEYGAPIIRQQSTDVVYFGGQAITGLSASGYMTIAAPFIFGNSVQAGGGGSSLLFDCPINAYAGTSTNPARGMKVRGTMTMQTNGFVNAFELTPFFNFDNSTGRIAKGFYYEPDITTIKAGDKHYGIQTTSGGAYINTATPDASAALQADSTTQGFLPPRMTTAEKTAIASPAAGLMVYDTSLNQMSYYNGSTWVNF